MVVVLVVVVAEAEASRGSPTTTIVVRMGNPPLMLPSAEVVVVIVLDPLVVKALLGSLYRDRPARPLGLRGDLLRRGLARSQLLVSWNP